MITGNMMDWFLTLLVVRCFATVAVDIFIHQLYL